MNYRAIIYYVGMVLKVEAAFLLMPLAASLYYGEKNAALGLIITAAIALVIGSVTDFILKRRKDDRAVLARDGLLLTAICWIVLSVFGALPFWLSGEVASFVDCLFEAVSGFTTTGSSILPVIQELPKGLLLWRSLTHWIGGMGVLVFLLAIVPKSGEHSVHVLRAESPGPSPGKLVPRLQRSSKILYTIYLVMTLVMIGMLIAGGMPVFDSLCNAMSTAGTGGFAINNASIALYDSVYLDVVITVFMILFGVNFNVYYFLLIKNFRAAWKNTELRAYLGILIASMLLIAVNLTGTVYQGFATSLRYASFQVGSIMTTTGFATADFSLWPEFSRMILLFLMVIGASAGSTGGGLKVSRLVILIKESRRFLARMSNPRSVAVVRMDEKTVDKAVVHGVNAYAITFMLIMAASFLLISLENNDFETTVSSVLACLNNVGPGLSMVSPAGNFAFFSPFSKVVLILDMLLGRLEIYPLLLLMSPRSWRR